MKYNLTAIPNLFDIINGRIEDKFINAHTYTTPSNETYIMLKYNKFLLPDELTNVYGMLKSVVVYNGRVISFAPPKTMSASDFMLKYPLKTDKLIAEEFVEGTMINLFYDELHSKWEISTRNTVGGHVRFYINSPMTFNEMFMEACNECNLNFELLNKSYCYSFVLQHTQNRIVTPFNNSMLYVVGIYQIENNEQSIYVNELDLNEKMRLMMHSNVKIPGRYEFNDCTELINNFASINTPYTTMGVVVKNIETGEMTKFRNPAYEEVRQLRGNQPKLQYQYLLLRKEGKVHEYLTFYPEAKSEFSKFRDQIHAFTDGLHRNYISCFVKKEQKMKYFSDRYKYHMISLHKHYIDELMPKKLFITHAEVVKYVNNLHPSVLMHALNYHLKKREFVS